MIFGRIISVLVLIYLLWRGTQAVRDFSARKVEVRRWWVVPWWQLNKNEPRIGSETISRDEFPTTFWFWTGLQACAIALLFAVFAAILVSQ